MTQITLTEKAAKHVASYIAKRGKGIGLRFGVRTSGCSGMAYKLEFVDAVNPDDVVFETKGSSSTTRTSRMSAAAARASTFRQPFDRLRTNGRWLVPTLMSAVNVGCHS